MAKIGMIGAGSWGTALTYELSAKGHEVTMWSALDDEVMMINRCHEQTEKLPGVILPESVEATTRLESAIKGMELLVLAVPSNFVRGTAKQMAPFVEEGQRIVSVAKGIEDGTLMLMTQIIEQEIPQARVGGLYGPTHAEEVGKGLPSAIVAGAADPELAAYIQETFASKALRVYTTSDIVGMQVGSALKNVIALAAGIADGLGYGDNTKAALITRGIAEIKRIGVAMGGRPETFAGLTGTGDLIVTCASMHSRNRRAGILIGQGKKADEAMREVKQVVEGVYCARAAVELSDKYGIDMPISREVWEILFEDEDPEQAVADLMMRDYREE